MIVGGRWSGCGRAWAHTESYARAYGLIGLLTVLLGPAVLIHLLSLIIVVPAALFANFFYVRLFPRTSWTREPVRAWRAGTVGVLLAWVGTLAWYTSGGDPPHAVTRLGDWGRVVYSVGIPVLFSNLGVLIGYLPPRSVQRTHLPEPELSRTQSTWPP